MIAKIINELRRNPFFSEISKAQSAAINKLSKEIGLDTESLKEAYKKYLVDKKIMNKLNYSAF